MERKENTKNHDLLTLLNGMLRQAYTPSNEEKQMLSEIRNDINDFAEHWDEGKADKKPYALVNVLNKMASKNLVLDNVDLAQLSALLKKIHGQRYGFDVCVLDRDNEGNFVSLHDTPDGKKMIPIDISLSAYLDAFVDKIFEYRKILNCI